MSTGADVSTSELSLEDAIGSGSERFLAPILLSDGTVDPSATCPMSDEQLLEALRLMTYSRTVDGRGVSYQRQGRIGTFAEVRGQEAVSVGTGLALDPAMDWIAQTYRELPALLHHGVPILQYWLMCIGHPAGWRMPEDVKVLPLQIELGAQLPHAVGLAWGLRLQCKPGVVLAYFGDGASSEGDFYEAGNLAGITEAPVVLLCQNNGWAISTPRRRQTRATTIAAKAAAFGIPGYVVDGNDVMAVYAATADAVRRARAGEGPTLIEARTYRVAPHNTSDDPTRYSPEEDVASWQARDPLHRLRTYLIAAGLWTEEEDTELRKDFEVEIDAAFVEAEVLAGAHTPAMLFEHVYLDLPSGLKRQQREIEAEFDS